MLAVEGQKRKAEEKSSVKIASAAQKKEEGFGDVPRTPAGQFDLYFLAATANLTRRLEQIFGTREAVFAEFPFLRIYDERLAGREPDDLTEENAPEWWRKTIIDWENTARENLPWRDLREKFELNFNAVILLVTIGLVEEDSRFGTVFEFFNENSDQKRLNFGTINGWRRAEKDSSANWQLAELKDLGLIQFGNLENPRFEWSLQVSTLLWDVLRGENQFGLGDWVKFSVPEDLLALDKLILPEILHEQIKLLPPIFERGDIQTIIVRGANHNGKKTILGALARSLGLGLLEAKNPEIRNDERWKSFGTLAVLLNAMPIFSLDVAPGEMLEFPAIPKAVKAFGVTLGKQGGISGAATEKSITLTVKMPEESERRELWENFLVKTQTSELNEISERFRLSSGNIRRVAMLAKSYAGLAERKKIILADVQQAARVLNRQALDTLTIYLEPLSVNWNFLAVRDETFSDLRQLEERCRMRENLRNYVGASLRGQLQAGVRALFNGGSGTGKTYAARLLAGALQKDIYRLDLSTIVNKYIGETEKNLARVFAFVEELDVILLLDEGDALLTQRTSVTSANDRYANLETNYLLQRLESFEGILIVTTNANDRIDSAFQRRMDTVVEFVAPEATERRQIWGLHLPENNNISEAFLEEIVQRCELTGGQIRNVTLHAASLSLSEKESLNGKHIEAAVRREYRKIGAICPLYENSETISKIDRW